jgi:flagellar protein FlaJ
VKNNKPLKRIEEFLSRLSAKLRLHLEKPSKASSMRPKERRRFTFNEPESVAYNVIGSRTAWFLPLFRDLGPTLHSSGLRVSFKAYISLTVLVTALVSTVTLILTPIMLLFFADVPLLAAILFGIGGSLFAVAVSTCGFYLYPIYRADKLKRGLEDELPFATGYMAILASAGVSPEKIFYSLSNMSVPLAATVQAKDVMRNVNLFGSDIISSLEQASKQTPSEKFREMIEGLISTIHSGGNLAAYLRDKSRQYMRLKRISLKKFSDTLSMLSEVYVALLLTGPLFVVIMLVVMAMLGGSDFGLLDPRLMLNLLTYIAIPLGSVTFLIVLDAISPKW